MRLATGLAAGALIAQMCRRRCTRQGRLAINEPMCGVNPLHHSSLRQSFKLLDMRSEWPKRNCSS